MSGPSIPPLPVEPRAPVRCVLCPHALAHPIALSIKGGVLPVGILSFTPMVARSQNIPLTLCCPAAVV
jgi:hypothetical protein